MSDDKLNTSQLRFVDGNLVEQSTEGEAVGEYTAEPIEPGDRTGFVVEVKSGAIDVNSELVEVIETHGRTFDFRSRSHAEDYARQLSASDGSLRIQAAPDNDPRDVDAYLLAEHNQSIKEPAEVNGDVWTFDVGANLYGTLGEAILLGSSKPHALYYFVRQDLNIHDDELENGLDIDIQSGSLVSFGDTSSDDRESWVPDCTVVAKDGWNGDVLERYYCEIKTGNASFERSQVATMERMEQQERVLKIRMFIEELPDRYSLRINEVESSN